MSIQINIGDMIFTSKKEALSYFRNILNSYNVDEFIHGNDFRDVSFLVEYGMNEDELLKSGIKEIQIIEVQYNTKCFEITFGDEYKHTFSYIYAINGKRKPLTKFTIACRNTIQEDLHRVKKKYFDEYSKKSKVKCQETGVLSSWDEINVDHRQPNTLSIIIDRYIELNSINVNDVVYQRDDINRIIFLDKKITVSFRKYHKEKANLRIVRKEINLRRSYQARLSKQTKDRKIE